MYSPNHLVSCINTKISTATDQEPVSISAELLSDVVVLVGTPSGVIANVVVATDLVVRVNAWKLCSADFVGSDPSSTSGSSPDSELDVASAADLVCEAPCIDVA